MQSKLFLTALLFSAVSSAEEPKDSAEDAFTTAPPRLYNHQFPRISEILDSYEASFTAEPEFIAVSKYIASASGDLQSEFDKEYTDYFRQLRTTKSVELPAHITALPSSFQDYISWGLESAAKIIPASEKKSSATRESAPTIVKTTSTATDKKSSPSSTGTQTMAIDAISGTQSNTTSSMNNTSNASGSSTTAAPILTSSSASQSSFQDTTSTTATLSSSSPNNAATQPTGAYRVVGALAVGVIGLVAMA